MKDTYRHKGLRKRLVETLQKKGIQSEKVLDAINRIPRHFFLDKAFEDIAYEDKAFPIGLEQTISQPFTVAYQTELLDISKREKVLEIGTGSGYQATVLAVIGARVFTVERHEPLLAKAKSMFELFNLGNIRAYFRDGYKGLPEFAPFDKVIVTAAAPFVPEALKQQLKIGGKLVIPVDDGNGQQMQRWTKISANEFEIEQFDKFRFVPFVKGKA
ncbi:MAG: protein-L-isoaspartate(D-aspartate) O-methyltransferase [Saprospiraceae bacterium]